MDPPATAQMVCHVLLVETDNGLVLIDTGFGSHDCADPARRLGPVRYLIRPVLRRDETAVAQVERLGFRPDDVRHIVITHFDADHIGGLADFSHAQVHVTSTEALAAMAAAVMGREGALPSHPMGTRPKDRRAQPRWRTLAGIRRRQGAQ